MFRSNEEADGGSIGAVPAFDAMKKTWGPNTTSKADSVQLRLSCIKPEAAGKLRSTSLVAHFLLFSNRLAYGTTFGKMSWMGESLMHEC